MGTLDQFYTYATIYIYIYVCINITTFRTYLTSFFFMRKFPLKAEKATARFKQHHQITYNPSASGSQLQEEKHLSTNGIHYYIEQTWQAHVQPY